MKFKTLSNQEIRMDIIPSRYPVRSREQSKSVGQYTLGRLIRHIYGFHVVMLEEFPLPGEKLVLDFYLPHHSLAFEYHGDQHDNFNKFFHVDKNGLKKQQERDIRKRAWCKINDITLIEIRNVSLSVEQLQQLIQDTKNGESIC